MSLSKPTDAIKKINSHLSAGQEDIAASIEKLRQDLAELASSIQKSGSDKTSEYRESLEGLIDGLSETTRSFTASSRKQAVRIEGDLLKKVSDHPYHALAIAAGAGALLALLTNRGGR